MKTHRSFLFFLLIGAIALGMASCEDSVVSELHYDAYAPVYLTRTQLEASVKKSAPRTLENPGKIYLYQHLLLINEPAKGIHLIDNSNPAAPHFLAFIELPGNYDMAVRNGLLYADNATDLVVIDLRQADHLPVVARVRDVFEEVYPEGQANYIQMDPNRGIIVDWRIEKVVERIDPHGQPMWLMQSGGWVTMESLDFSASKAAAPVNQSGKPGSMARFNLYQNYLYTLQPWSLSVFDIANPSAPEQKTTLPTDWFSETLFVRDNELFVGTRNGMLIYSLQQAQAPSFVSSISHWRACDPVVVEGSYAYITLRSGTRCGGWADELQVVDISQIETPKLVANFPLAGPYGLGYGNGQLFVCDGNAGLKVFDASDPLHVGDRLVQHFPELHAMDVIPTENSLLMVGDNGLYQYAYTDNGGLKEISRIAVK